MPKNAKLSAAPNPQLIPVPIQAPGRRGLNLQEQNTVLSPDWAIEAQNAVIDYSGRVSSRNGLTSVTTSNGSGTIRTFFEYRTATGGTTLIVASDGSLSSNIGTPGDNSIGGSISWPAGNRWFFSNFNNKVIGFQQGQTPIVYNGTGTFTAIVAASGSVPTGGVGTAAFGRVWAMNADGHTLQWCALLDETNWGTGDSGSIDLAKVWPAGMDQVTAIKAFNGSLVIFGTRQVLFYGSTSVSPIGLDVTQITLLDTLEGVGCISQWTVADVGGETEPSDLIFCSKIGIQSLQRLLINKSRPVTQLSKYVRDALIAMLSVENTQNITGFYSPTNGFYALSLPVSGYTWVADQRHRYTDEYGDDVAPITRWLIAPTAMVEASGRKCYMSNQTGVVAQYTTGNDYGANFQFILRLPWMDLGQDFTQYLKALKRISLIVYLRTPVSVMFAWYTDFSQSGDSNTITLPGPTTSEWGNGQWGLSEWSAGLTQTILTSPASRTGQYFSVQITTSTDSWFTVQQINLMSKRLRIA